MIRRLSLYFALLASAFAVSYQVTVFVTPTHGATGRPAPAVVAETGTGSLGDTAPVPPPKRTTKTASTAVVRHDGSTPSPTPDPVAGKVSPAAVTVADDPEPTPDPEPAPKPEPVNGTDACASATPPSYCLPPAQHEEPAPQDPPAPDDPQDPVTAPEG